MFGRKKKCKECGQELVKGRDVGPWCEVCTIDVLRSKTIDYSQIEPGTDEYHNLSPVEKIAWFDAQGKDLKKMGKAIKKSEKEFDLDD